MTRQTRLALVYLEARDNPSDLGPDPYGSGGYLPPEDPGQVVTTAPPAPPADATPSPTDPLVDFGTGAVTGGAGAATPTDTPPDYNPISGGSTDPYATLP